MKKQTKTIYLEGSDKGFYLRTEEDILASISDDELEMAGYTDEEGNDREKYFDDVLLKGIDGCNLQVVKVDDETYSKVVKDGCVDVSDKYEWAGRNM